MSTRETGARAVKRLAAILLPLVAVVVALLGPAPVEPPPGDDSGYCGTCL